MAVHLFQLNVGKPVAPSVENIHTNFAFVRFFVFTVKARNEPTDCLINPYVAIRERG